MTISEPPNRHTVAYIFAVATIKQAQSLTIADGVPTTCSTLNVKLAQFHNSLFQVISK